MAECNTAARILIADDHALFRAALRKLLELDSGIAVVGEASNGWEAMELLESLQPDLLLLDLNMPRQSGLDVLRRLMNMPTKARIIILAAVIERKQIIEALRLGAFGVLHKDTATQLLYKCIRTVMANEYWIDHDSVSDLVSTLRSPRASQVESDESSTFSLTPRQYEILLTVVDGCTNREIAEKFMISEQTVKHHMTRIFEKVGVSNRLELALFAMSKRLVCET